MRKPKQELTCALDHLEKAAGKLLKQRGSIRVSQAERHTIAALKRVRDALELLADEKEETCEKP